MPDFGSPFAGQDIDRKMTKDEIVRAVRFAIAAEYEAIQLYRQIANATDEEFVADVMNEVADEEVVHAGEFLEVLKKIQPSEAKFYDEGAKEVNDHFGKKEGRVARELVKIAKSLIAQPHPRVEMKKLQNKSPKGWSTDPNWIETTQYMITVNLDYIRGEEYVEEWLRDHHKRLAPTRGRVRDGHGQWYQNTLKLKSKRSLLDDSSIWILDNIEGYSGG